MSGRREKGLRKANIKGGTVKEGGESKMGVARMPFRDLGKGCKERRRRKADQGGGGKREDEIHERKIFNSKGEKKYLQGEGGKSQRGKTKDPREGKKVGLSRDGVLFGGVRKIKTGETWGKINRKQMSEGRRCCGKI